MAKGTQGRFFCTLTEPVTTFPHAVTLSDAFSVNHARNVLRLKAGDPVVLVDGVAEIAYGATVIRVEREALHCELQGLQPQAQGIEPSVTLAVAIIKEHRWDWLLQKATELGVRRFVPLVTERCLVREHHGEKTQERHWEKKQARWRNILQAAALQSEGLFLPMIEAPVSVATFLAQPAPEPGPKILLLERGEARRPLREVLPVQTPPACTVAIGPEGGWTDDEIAQWVSAGFEAASLGQRVLRTETVVMAWMTALIYAYEDR